jgi:hypothetical protein
MIFALRDFRVAPLGNESSGDDSPMAGCHGPPKWHNKNAEPATNCRQVFHSLLKPAALWQRGIQR